VYLVVFLSPIEAMFVCIYSNDLSQGGTVYDLRKVTSVTRYSLLSLSHYAEVGGTALSGRCQI
jgi:hypothetical protein